MTPKQQRFVNEYLATSNASEAYRRAYNCKNMKTETINHAAHKLLANSKVAPTVRAVQSEANKKAVKAHELTREWIIEHLILNAKMAMGLADIPFSVIENGVKTTKTYRKVDHAAASKALELLGRVDAIGLFLDRKQVDFRHEIAQMDDRELEAYIHERMN